MIPYNDRVAANRYPPSLIFRAPGTKLFTHTPMRPTPVTIRYEFNSRQYVKHRNGIPCSAPMDAISLAFDREDGILHKHGEPKLVEAWAEDARERLSRGGEIGKEMANNLIVVTGRFPLTELNTLLACSSYAPEMLRKLLSGELQEEPLVPVD